MINESVKMSIKRFFYKYPDIDRDLDLTKLKDVYNKIKEVSPFTLVTYDKDIKSYALASLLMRNGKYESMRVLNGYKIIDIYLGNDEEVSSILDLESDIICIYLGYSEMENRRQSDLIEQLMEQQKLRHHKLWILYKGTDLDERYPKLSELNKELNGIRYDIRSSSDNKSKSISLGEDEF